MPLHALTSQQHSIGRRVTLPVRPSTRCCATGMRRRQVVTPRWKTVLEAKVKVLQAKNEVLQAKNEATNEVLQAKNEVLQAKNETLQVKNETTNEVLQAKNEVLQAKDVAYKLRLECANGQIMHLQGLVNSRGIFEYTERLVLKPCWVNSENAPASYTRQQLWQFFLSQDSQKELLACLEGASKKKGSKSVSFFMAALYERLSDNIHGSEDTHAPSSYSPARRVYISGPPADTAALVCLCKEFNYPYEVEVSAAAALMWETDSQGEDTTTK